MWLARVKSLVRASPLFWSPAGELCWGELPVLLQLETSFLLIFMVQML